MRFVISLKSFLSEKARVKQRMIDFLPDNQRKEREGRRGAKWTFVLTERDAPPGR